MSLTLAGDHCSSFPDFPNLSSARLLSSSASGSFPTHTPEVSFQATVKYTIQVWHNVLHDIEHGYDLTNPERKMQVITSRQRIRQDQILRNFISWKNRTLKLVRMS
jgi:hypothetical protein